VLGTVCTVNLYERGSSRVYREIFSRLREIENRMSANLADSELELINKNAGIEPFPAHEDLIELIERALYFCELSNGAFDITVGPLVKLWDIGGNDPRLPSPVEINAVLPLIAWRDIIIDKEAGTVFLARKGMRLDLGAIAKGYAGDEAARIIRAAGIPRAIIDLGGNIFALGEKAGKVPWRVGIQNPVGDRGSYMGILEIRDKTLVTSGVYERYSDIEGKRYHHILSTADGYPAESGLLSVTVTAETSADADALSTALFVLGYEKGKALAESMNGVYAIFVFDDMSIRGSLGALDNFSLGDDAFKIATD
jgi:thiamine biosynthesis lipoprotein